MAPVGKDKERPLAQVFTQPLRDQRRQPLEAQAQIDRLDRKEHFQSAGEA
jgi:hypothetical protein